MYQIYRRDAPLATDSSGPNAPSSGKPGFITSGVLAPSFTPTRAPDPTEAPVFTSTPQESSSPISSSADASQSTGTTTSSSSSIPLGTLVGAIVGSILFLALVIILVVWQSKKQKERMKRSVSTRRNYERRKSGREMAWKELGGGSVEGGGAEENKMQGLQAYPPLNNNSNHQRHLSPSSIPQIPKMSPIFDSKEFKSVLGGRTPSPSSFSDQPQHSTFQQQQQQPMIHPYNNLNNARPSPPATTTTTAVAAKQEGQEVQYPAFSHPYAKVPGVVPSSPSEGSFYTASSPGMASTFSQQQQQPPSSPSGIPMRTGDRSHNHNPFFTAHPSAEEYNKSGREKWGSIGKERVVSMSMSMSDDNNNSVVIPPSTTGSGGGGEERAPSRLESLIAALDFGGGTAGLETPPNKSRLASIYSTASSTLGAAGDTDYEQAYGDAIGTNLTTRSSHLHYSNPFEFDQVYGIIHAPQHPEEEVVRDSFRSSGVGGLMSGLPVPPGTGTTAEFSERSMVLSPSEFPMPPPR